MRGFGMMRYAFQFWAFLIVWCGGAWAQDTDVTLTSKQGGMVIRGTVLDYDGRYISLDSDAGPIVFDATLFDCQGRLCPTLRPTQENVTLTVPQGLSLIALPALIENFALRRAYSLKQIPQTDGLQRYELTSNADSDRKFEITLITANSETAIENLVNQSADWAIAFRELTATELAKLRDPSVSSIRSSVKSAVVALDALVPVVAPPNDRSEIHLSNLIDQIKTASDQINIASEHFDYGARFGWQGYDQIWHDGAMGDVVDTLYQNPDKLGLVPFSNLSGLQVAALTGDCGHMPRLSNRSIKSGDYPLIVPIFLHQSPFTQGPQATSFFDYVTSADARLVIERAGFVGLSTAQTPWAQQGDRLHFAISQSSTQTLDVLQTATRDLQTAARLTTSFRFATGTSDLDAQSKANLDLIATLISQGRFDGKNLYFSGFSDGQGDFDANVKLSQERAQTVMQEITRRLPKRQLDIGTMTAKGYGPVLPMACETTDLGRSVNRRVEIWVE